MKDDNESQKVVFDTEAIQAEELRKLLKENETLKQHLSIYSEERTEVWQVSFEMNRVLK